ncbi:INO80 complex subunit 2 [Sphaceloma murrayae]|uniref:INO80 complex subunit 2 n=1 Tax=Sphaceloma murrayae TaxID=2082308 RepID=A0A2K1R102_9PEZI|nr:INO80 complex subunit 2 [Sphaceloma murrayae]
MDALWDQSRLSFRLLFSVVELMLLASDCLKTIVDAVVVLWCKPRKRLLALGADLPGVDLVIASCGEDVDVILDTVRAALDLDYPADRFRVTVTDDGDSQELKKAIEGLQHDKLGPGLYYTARIKTSVNRNKASNLNHAMEVTANFPGEYFPFFANLDADMIPERSFLRSSMAHFLLDQNLALTNPPPSCYNQPVNDPLQQTLNVTFKWAELIKDLAGCAWCTGSGFVVKKEAVTRVGGFPSKTLSEDVHLSSLVLREGWNVAYLAEALQYGLVPETFTGHLKQYTRWSVGTIQAGLAMKMYIDSQSALHMSFLQRLYMFLPPFAEIRLLITNVYMWVSLMLLLQGQSFAPHVGDEDLPRMVRASAAAFMATGINLMAVSLATTGCLRLRASANETWMAPYRSMAHLKSIILPKRMGGTVMRFIATGSIRHAMKERDSAQRPHVFRRLYSILLLDGAWYHTLYASLCWLAVGSAIRRAAGLYPGYSAEFWRYLLLHVAWCPLPWLFHSVAMLVPLRYAIFPPTTPDREDFLDRDPKTGVAHPKAEYRQIRWTGSFGYEILWIGGLVSPRASARQSAVSTSKPSIRLTVKAPPSKLRQALSGDDLPPNPYTEGTDSPEPPPRNARSSRNPRAVIDPDSDEEMDDAEGEDDEEEDAQGEEDDGDEEQEDDDEGDDDDEDEDEEEEDAEGEEDEADDEDIEGDTSMAESPHPPPPVIKTVKAAGGQGKIDIKVTAPPTGPLKSVEEKEMEMDGMSDLGSDEEEEGEEDDEEDLDSDGMPRESTPDVTKLTRRQKAAYEESLEGGLMALSNEAQKKKHLTAEEHAMRRAEMARRRKNLSEKRNEEEKADGYDQQAAQKASTKAKDSR